MKEKVIKIIKKNWAKSLRYLAPLVSNDWIINHLLEYAYFFWLIQAIYEYTYKTASTVCCDFWAI